MSANTNQDNPLLTIAAISLFTADLASAIKFYTTVFEAPINYQDAESCSIKFSNNSLIINLLDSSVAGDLVKPRSVAKPGDGKALQLSIWTKDLEGVMERLKARGVELLSGPETMPWGMRVITFEDPGGHVWEIGQKVA